MKKLFELFKPTAPSSTQGVEAHKSLIEQAYRHLLQREVDEEGLKNYSKRFQDNSLSPGDLIEELVASEEYQQRIKPYHYTHDPVLTPFLETLDKPLSQSLQDCSALSQTQYESLWQQVFGGERNLVIGQQEYGRQHKQRFRELCNALMELSQPEAKVLEFGISEFSGIYKNLCPSLHLDCADRPTGEDYIGFNADTSLRVSGGNQFIAVDLNKPRTLLDEEYQSVRGQYDLVLFTEVLEHLTANPVDILEQLLALLREGGRIYLTTPNFFRRENLEKIKARENPQEAYPAGKDNWDAHHHHREYGLKELLQFVVDAGGKTEAFYFSDCWDEHPPENESEWGNMVFVIGCA